MPAGKPEMALCFPMETLARTGQAEASPNCTRVLVTAGQPGALLQSRQDDKQNSHCPLSLSAKDREQIKPG